MSKIVDRIVSKIVSRIVSKVSKILSRIFSNMINIKKVSGIVGMIISRIVICVFLFDDIF